MIGLYLNMQAFDYMSDYKYGSGESCNIAAGVFTVSAVVLSAIGTAVGIGQRSDDRDNGNGGIKRIIYCAAGVIDTVCAAYIVLLSCEFMTTFLFSADVCFVISLAAVYRSDADADKKRERIVSRAFTALCFIVGIVFTINGYHEDPLFSISNLASYLLYLIGGIRLFIGLIKLIASLALKRLEAKKGVEAKESAEGILSMIGTVIFMIAVSAVYFLIVLLLN